MSPRTNLLLLNAAFLRPQVRFVGLFAPSLLVAIIRVSTGSPGPDPDLASEKPVDGKLVARPMLNGLPVLEFEGHYDYRLAA